MSLDPYLPCPGGTGKKVKFCCPDLVGELGQISRMLSGDQRQACLEHIARLEAKYPGRACLLATKAGLENNLGRTDAAARTVEQLLAEQPNNPIALAESAVLIAGRDGARSGVEPLQKAIAASGDDVSPLLLDAIGTLAGALLAEGHILAARAHLWLQLRLRPDHEPARQLLLRLDGSTLVPLLFKEDPVSLAACPPGALWQAEYDDARQLAQRACWRAAAQKFAALTERAADSPAVWRSLAVLRGWLADEAGAAAALRRFAALDVPLDDAIEAEALAQLIDPEAVAETMDVLGVTYAVSDIDQLTARLSSDRRAVDLTPAEVAGDRADQPPPRAGFWLLDRAMPATGVGIAEDAVPEVTGRVLLFGRETDREARAELSLARDRLPAAAALLAELGGEGLGAAGPEEVVGQVPAIERVMSWHCQLPEDTPVDHAQSLAQERRRKLFLEQWPRTPHHLFGGRSAEEVAADPAQRVKLLAAILVLELSTGSFKEPGVFNLLRSRLGLPTADPIDPDRAAVGNLPLARLARVMVQKLSDDDLLAAYLRAGLVHADAALRKLALEIVSRPSLADKVNQLQAYAVLVRLETNSRQALEYLALGRSAAQRAGQSCGPWDLDELSLRLHRGEAEEASQLVKHLQAGHSEEPGVAEAVVKILVEAGVITPQGKAPGPPPAEDSQIVVPGGSTAPAGKIWTPQSETGEGKKAALWTPGTD